MSFFAANHQFRLEVPPRPPPRHPPGGSTRRLGGAHPLSKTTLSESNLFSKDFPHLPRLATAVKMREPAACSPWSTAQHQQQPFNTSRVAKQHAGFPGTYQNGDFQNSASLTSFFLGDIAPGGPTSSRRQDVTNAGCEHSKHLGFSTRHSLEAGMASGTRRPHSSTGPRRDGRVFLAQGILWAWPLVGLGGLGCCWRCCWCCLSECGRCFRNRSRKKNRPLSYAVQERTDLHAELAFDKLAQFLM